MYEKVKRLNSILAYFDLNERAASSAQREKGLSKEPIVRAKKSRLSSTVPQYYKEKMSVGDQLLMYGGLLIGVIFSSAVMQFKAKGTYTLNLNLPSVLISAIVALIIIPHVYEKLSIKSHTPPVVRLGIFVQNGVFWPVLIESISKVIIG